MIRVFVFPVLSTVAAGYATVALAQAPMAVHQLQGTYCTRTRTRWLVLCSLCRRN